MRGAVVLMSFGLATLFGATEPPISLPNGVTVSLNRKEDGPEFERTYIFTVLNGFTVEITAKTFMGSVMMDGKITQPGGEYIFFDPNRVADKIIDRDLAPRVQSVSDQIIEEDRQFRSNPPLQWTDRQGVTWYRQP